MTTEEAVLFCEQNVSGRDDHWFPVSVSRNAGNISLYFELRRFLDDRNRQRLDELIEALKIPRRDERERYLFVAAYHALDNPEKRNDFTNRIESFHSELTNIFERRVNRSTTEKIKQNLTEIKETLKHFEYSLYLRMWVFANIGFDEGHYMFTKDLYEFVKQKKGRVEDCQKKIERNTFLWIEYGFL